MTESRCGRLRREIRRNLHFGVVNKAMCIASQVWLFLRQRGMFLFDFPRKHHGINHWANDDRKQRNDKRLVVLGHYLGQRATAESYFVLLIVRGPRIPPPMPFFWK